MSRISTHVALVRDFVNTVELDEEGSDEIATPEGLGEWLAKRGLAPPTVTRSDVARAAELREALRALLKANNGIPVESASAHAVVEEAARRAGIELRFDVDGVLVPAPASTNVAGALGAIVAATSQSMQEGSWTRLKACRAEDCHFAFYDEARNRTRAWCSMESCGNRAKVRAYRRRRQALPSRTP